MLKSFFKYLLLICCLINSVYRSEAQGIESAKDVIGATLESIMVANPDLPDNVINDLAVRLGDLFERKIDLNRDDLNALLEFRLLDEIQVQNIITHRELYGDFINFLELQSVSGLDISDIIRIRPFLKSIDEDFNSPFHLSMLYQGRKQLLIRYVRGLEEKKGFTGDAPAYLGSPDRFMINLRHIVPGRVSVGLAMEKDEGEPFSREYNPLYFDFISFHVDVQKVNRLISRVVLGDFQASMGQGLVMYSGYGFGKSSFTTNVKKAAGGLRPSTGINEIDALRGAGIELSPGKHLKILGLVSYRQTDGNIIAPDTLDAEDREYFFTSFQTSGLHRNRSEIEDKGVIGQLTAGGSVKWYKKRLSISANSIYDRLDQPYQVKPQLYNKYYFSGKTAWNNSMDYSYTISNVHLFGEIAVNSTLAPAFMQGALIGLHPKASVVFLYRNLAPEYYALHGNAFADNSETTNEEGLYTGIELRPIPYLVLNAFADFYKHRWAIFQASAPSVGKDFLFKVAYQKRRQWDTYVQIKFSNEQIDGPSTDIISSLVERKKLNVRMHFNQKIAGFLTWSSRLEWMQYQLQSQTSANHGVLFYQELWARPLGKPVSGYLRFTNFNSDSYDSRIYAYEHYVAYDSRNTPFYGTGNRLNIGGRYKFRFGLTLDAAYNITKYTNQQSVGSGNDLIQGNLRSDFRLQLRYGIDDLF
ncbi:MAG TPA: helix-hairpin-helix domain-containing protein [Saprospiraceae bacterium]|nr:helix-hairpin-helix domain-containing protein [Saprospiraceae bacterium]